MASPLTSPLAFDPGLRLAIVGRDAAGKTSLLTHLLHAAPPQPPSSSTAPVAPKVPHPVLLRLLRSPFATIFRRATHAVSYFTRGALQNARCTEASFRPLPNAPPATVWDAAGESGIVAVAIESASNFDVLLYVSRLDESRIASRDKLILNALVYTFGEDVLQKIVVVLTHGCSLPPVNLSYADFVRGRTDLIMRYVDGLFPPKRIEVGEMALVDHGNDVLSDDDDSGQFLLRNDDFVVQQDHEDPDAGENTMDIVDDPVDALFQQLRRVAPCEFEQARQVPAVVVELSDSCPRDDMGMKILPDGKPWLPQLVQTIAQVAQQSREKAQLERQREAVERERAIAERQNVGRGGKFWKKFMNMVRSFSEDGIRVMWAQFALFLLGVQLFSALQYGQQRRRLEATSNEADDILYQLSDEEWDKITKPDSPKESSSIPDDEDYIVPEEFFGPDDRADGAAEEDGVDEKALTDEEYDALNTAKINEKMNKEARKEHGMVLGNGQERLGELNLGKLDGKPGVDKADSTKSE